MKLMISVREVTGSSLSLDLGYNASGFVVIFSSPSRELTIYYYTSRPLPVPSEPFHFRYSLIVLPNRVNAL
jgi:hypothetical protein